MTAHHRGTAPRLAELSTGAERGPDTDDPLLTAADPLAAARDYIARTALRDGPVQRVGLELEFHLVDLGRPERRPTWPEVQALLAGLPDMPSASRVTLEPGGQVELSTPPARDIGAAIDALRADRAVLQSSLEAAGYGAAALGADPARPLQRVNPTARYVAMEQHFAAVGCAGPGRAMMTATAALQVNVDAGPRAGWARRLDGIRALGPVLVALSACSPYLAGRASGWRSMRQQAWHGIDHRRSDPVPVTDPAEAWARYALAAPVMLVRGRAGTVPMTTRIPFAAWLSGHAPIARRVTLADLDYHLTTLFPPFRPRGYLEIRCVDAVPDRWWPALAAVTTTLVDDDVAAGHAAEACSPVRDAWVRAARDGLGDAELRAAAVTCVAAAAQRCPDALRSDVVAFAELVDSGRTPGDELRARIDAVGPLAALEEAAHGR
jgi:glutamate--cysteine ligase